MKIVAARLNHETNTYSPLPTPLASFGSGSAEGPAFGAAAFAQAKGTRSGLGAFIDAATTRGADLVVALNAAAYPSGRVDNAAFEQMADAIVDAVKDGCELLLLDLHGAMVTTTFDDAEGELLRRVRAAAPATPIAVALDLHGNVTRQMAAHADAIVGFKTYPHIDMYETGAHAARLGFEMVDRHTRFAIGYAQPPLMSHTLRSATTEPSAMARAVRRAELLEAGGLHAASVFAGFSLADITDAGMSVVVVGDEPGLAQAAADALARELWDDRDGFVYSSQPLSESIAQALQMRAAMPHERAPILLLDHGDNVMSGGTCDTTAVLQEAMRQGLRTIGCGPLADPQTVARCVAAGVGSKVDIELGNKVPLGLAEPQQPPLPLQVTVRAISDGRFTISGPIYTGETWCMGPTVALDFDGGTVVVCELPMEPIDTGVYRCLGLDPQDFDYLILKSRMYCRPVFEPLSAGLVECDSRGVTGSDYGLFSFSRVRRPIYPLDTGAATPIYP